MKLLVCEGDDDRAVLSELCEASGISGITIESFDGRNKFERFITKLKIRPEFTRQEVESLGVVLDAEANFGAGWQKVQNAIHRGFAVSLTEHGVFVGDSPRIGGFVMPGFQKNGMLESLCLEAVSGRPGYSCMEDYFKCLSEKTEKKEYHAKARFRAWMASQSDFELYVGKAAKEGYIPWEHAAFDPVREFLRKL